MSLLDDVSIVVTPNGYKARTLFGAIPVPTEGSDLVTGANSATTVAGTYTDVQTNYGGAIGDVLKVTFTLGGDYRLKISSWFNYFSINSDIEYNSGVNVAYIRVTGNNYGSGDLRFNNVATSTVGGTISDITVKVYVSADMDVTRATAATRVDENGLVNYAEILGGEEVTNGDFTQLPLGTSWDAYTSGSSTVAFTEGAILSIDGSNSNVGVYQQNIFTNGVQYKIVVSVKATASFDAEIVESQGAATQTTIGTVSLTTSYQDFVFYFTGTGTNDLFIHRLYGETTGQNQQIYVKEVSVKELTRDNVPRIDYTGGGCPHILAEPQRTNLLPYSEDFSEWLTSGSPTITYNATTSPDGTTNATELLSTSNSSRFQLNLGTLSAVDYTQSVFVKYKDADVRINFKNNQHGGSNTFNITSSGVTLDASSNSTSIEDIGSGWYKISVTYTATGSGTSYLQIFGDLDATYASYYLWGAQLEEGSYATSYIPTDGSTVTRVQDQYEKTGISNLINSEEGVLFVEMALLNNTGNYKSLSISDGTTDNRVTFENRPVLNQIKAFVNVSGTNVMSSTQTLTDVKEFNKMALKWKQNDFAWWVNGVEIYTDTSGNTFSADTLNRLAFDRGDGFIQLEGKVKQLQVYKTALTDTELATLTTI